MTYASVIDSHAHLLSQYYENIDNVLAKANEANVKIMIVPAVNIDTCQESINLAQKHENIYAAIGHHPHEANLYNKDTETRLYELAKHPKVVAIGETGLDFHYNLSSQAQQLDAFRSQINIAKDLNKPVIVHCRDAFKQTFDLLAELDHKIGVFHCFTGNPQMLEEIYALNFHISFSGIITFPKSFEIQETAKLMHLDKMLIETDCPYLTPVPHRGKTNEPKYIWHTLNKIASLRSMNSDDLAQITVANTQTLFNLPINK